MSECLIHTINGKIQNPEVIRKIIANLGDGHHMVKVTSQKARSKPQNAYFHGVMLPIIVDGLREAGWDDVHDAEDAKNIVKALFLTRTSVNKKTGETAEMIRNTSGLTTLEFTEFIDRLIKWGAEYLNIQIPYPNEYFHDK